MPTNLKCRFEFNSDSCDDIKQGHTNFKACAYDARTHLAPVAPAAATGNTVSTAEVASEATSDHNTVGKVEAKTTAGTNDTTNAVAATELADVPVPQAAASPEAGNALAERAREDVAAAADGEPESEAGALGVDVFLLEDLEGDFDRLGADEGFEFLHLFLGGVVHVDVGDVGICGERCDLVVLLLLAEGGGGVKAERLHIEVRNKCAEGAPYHSDADVGYVVGNQDIIDIINDSIKKFQSSAGRVGAEGVMKCDSSKVDWGLY
ncbi:hypothetical protein BJ165DRAFT_1524072 [Panaeolus papilionaceus]|nr:hypothetical protein BJ165DRAFT_1524072 [Panaeolus papilionaceus]